jgi:ubiquinone/menaquinone biosynthesis C-methylase UbiE
METGNFGKVRDAYVAARQVFPPEVIKYIWQPISVTAPTVLDIGCGTGIATRQLAEHRDASLIGCDVDQKMIEVAQERPARNITYVVAPADHLPFASDKFDTVTAFSAFHWFKDEQSLSEIQRVLKESGTFFVINKNDIHGFRKGYKRKLAKLIGKTLSSPKDNYDPAVVMQESGFTNVVTKVFLSEERFSLNTALRHIQSAAAWGEVPAGKEQAAIELMRNHIAETAVHGQAIRELEIVVVSGRKK